MEVRRQNAVGEYLNLTAPDRACKFGEELPNVCASLEARALRDPPVDDVVDDASAIASISSSHDRPPSIGRSRGTAEGYERCRKCPDSVSEVRIARLSNVGLTGSRPSALASACSFSAAFLCAA